MSEGTCDMSAGFAYSQRRPSARLAAAAIRMGRMLEEWGRRVGRPVDHEAVRRARVRADAADRHRDAVDHARMLRGF
jgi:hypothetical protein